MNGSDSVGADGGGDGDSAGDGVVRAERWAKPWWRSVGFWIGAWVLAFLVWAWVDSFWHQSQVTHGVWVEFPGADGSGFVGGKWTLQQGSLVISDGKPMDATPDLRLTGEWPVFSRWSEGEFGRGVEGLWGMRWEDWKVSENVGGGPVHRWVTVRMTDRWCHFGFVVAGYVVVWVSVMFLWRWWRWRRFVSVEFAGKVAEESAE
ncbi:hypothetical protein [Luteolibacter soli]|uniref:Transmembrane protein n=1 Tax=Luteolibacter soli TaxID=3135280 RepID=A0ABU9AWZ3_9BACT